MLDPDNTLANTLAQTDDAYQLLGFIDPYGDTTFNRLAVTLRN